jgi:hypothetical protein
MPSNICFAARSRVPGRLRALNLETPALIWFPASGVLQRTTRVPCFLLADLFSRQVGSISNPAVRFRRSARRAALHRFIFLSPHRSAGSRASVPRNCAQTRVAVPLARCLPLASRASASVSRSMPIPAVSLRSPFRSPIFAAGFCFLLVFPLRDFPAETCSPLAFCFRPIPRAICFSVLKFVAPGVDLCRCRSSKASKFCMFIASSSVLVSWLWCSICSGTAC